MATVLNRPVTRKTTMPHRGRQMVVTMYPGDVIGVRHERRRKEYQVPLSWVYDMAVKAEVMRQKAERAKRKKVLTKR